MKKSTIDVVHSGGFLGDMIPVPNINSPWDQLFDRKFNTGGRLMYEPHVL